jgi:hypothetical protein
MRINTMTTTSTTTETPTPVAPAATVVSQPQPPAESPTTSGATESNEPLPAPEAVTGEGSAPEEVNILATVDTPTAGQTTRLPELTSDDICYLKEREDIVTGAGMAASKALHEIHSYQNGSLWRKDHESFEQYCDEKWGYGKAHAYRLSNAGRLLVALEAAESPRGDSKFPENEGQVRKLVATVPQERQVECWSQIAAGRNVANLTGPYVAAESRKFLKKHNILPKPRKSKESKTAETSLADETLRHLKKLGIKLEKLLIPGTYEHLISSIEALITESSQNPDCTLESSSPDPVEQGHQERLGLTGSSLGGDRTPTPVTPGEGRTAPTDQPDAEGVITANRVANIMAGLDSADEESCVPSPEENHSARAESPSASTPQPPTSNHKPDVERSPVKATKEKGKSGVTCKPTVAQEDRTPDLPGMKPTDVAYTEEFPKKGWWVNTTTTEPSDPESEPTVMYQLMHNDDPQGNPAEGEFARKRFEAAAEKLNNMSN